MERHEFSSQSFLPLDVSRWIVVVAPSGTDGGPDPSRAVAFLVGPSQGVTYDANTWHHPLTILDWPARFAVVMWRDGTRTDEEFRTLAAPFTVELPGGSEPWREPTTAISSGTDRIRRIPSGRTAHDWPSTSS
jgi:ureidoglycolate lyase